MWERHSLTGNRHAQHARGPRLSACQWHSRARGQECREARARAERGGGWWRRTLGRSRLVPVRWHLRPHVRDFCARYIPSPRFLVMAFHKHMLLSASPLRRLQEGHLHVECGGRPNLGEETRDHAVEGHAAQEVRNGTTTTLMSSCSQSCARSMPCRCGRFDGVPLTLSPCFLALPSCAATFSRLIST